MERTLELEVALDVERQLAVLLVRLPKLGELPIAPLRGVDDLVRLELAVPRFAAMHRSKQSKVLVRAVRAILEAARTELRRAAPAGDRRFSNEIAFCDTQPAVQA